MDLKFCKDCNDYRPFEAFSKNARAREGLAFYCRDHLAARGLGSREALRTKPRVNRRPPDGLAVPDGKKWCADCERVLPLDSFVRSVATASGYSSYCRPCHNSRSRTSRQKVGGSRTYHLTRRYGNCNGGLGQSRDDPAVLRAAADYVEEHRRRQEPQPLRLHRVQVTARPPGRRAGLRIWRVRHQDLLSDRCRAELAAFLDEA